MVHLPIEKKTTKPSFVLIQGGWSFPKPNSDTVKNLPRYQLYDLTVDIGEENNLQAQQPDVLEQ